MQFKNLFTNIKTTILGIILISIGIHFIYIKEVTIIATIFSTFLIITGLGFCFTKDEVIITIKNILAKIPLIINKLLNGKS